MKNLHPLRRESVLLLRTPAGKSDRIEKSACHDFQTRNVFEVIGMHVGTQVSDTFLDVPDAFSRSPFSVEKDNVIGVGLGIVAADETQKGGFARTVLPCQCPVLPFPDRPVYTLEDLPPAVFYGDTLHFQHKIIVIFRKRISGRKDYVSRIDFIRTVLEKILRERRIPEKFLPVHRRQQCPVPDRLDSVHPPGNILCLAQYENGLKAFPVLQFRQHSIQGPARRLVQSDKGIVEDKDLGFVHQCPGYQKFSQFAARQGYNPFFQEFSYTEKRRIFLNLFIVESIEK